MDSKMLSVRSFEKNQILVGLINRIITYLRLHAHGIQTDSGADDFNNAKNKLIVFLQSIDKVVTGSTGDTALIGADMRERSFIRKYLEAKRRPQQYKSLLFKKSPAVVIELLNKDSVDDHKALVDSLTDLRNLINEHLFIDLKDLVGDI